MEVWTFGSVANDVVTSSSDLDLAVVLLPPEDPETRRKERRLPPHALGHAWGFSIPALGLSWIPLLPSHVLPSVVPGLKAEVPAANYDDG